MKYKVLEQVEAELQLRDRQIELLRAENQKLKDEHYKDKELSLMKTKLQTMQKAYNLGFPISASNSNKINIWKENHDATEHSNPKGFHGVSGGGFTYSFYPSAIAVFGRCTCDICENNAYKNAIFHGKFDKKLYTQYMEEHDGFIEWEE